MAAVPSHKVRPIVGFNSVALPDLPAVPGMIKPEEGRYYFWLTSEYHDGSGAVIEIGTWLGRSTIHLAAGLAAGGYAGPLICYDHFEWAGGANWAVKASRGDDGDGLFLQQFRANTADFAELLDVRRAKVQDIRLDPGPVSVMVLDAPKKIGDIAAISIQLSGRAIPGHTVLAWQDFLHPASFQIPAALYALRDFQTPCHFMAEGTAVGFRVTRNWTAQDCLPGRMSHKGWTEAQCRTAWDYWDPFVPEGERASFRSGLAMLLFDTGHVTAAKTELASLFDDDLCLRRWTKWRDTSLVARFRPLFDLVPKP